MGLNFMIRYRDSTSTVILLIVQWTVTVTEIAWIIWIFSFKIQIRQAGLQSCSLLSFLLSSEKSKFRATRTSHGLSFSRTPLRSQKIAVTLFLRSCSEASSGFNFDAGWFQLSSISRSDCYNHVEFLLEIQRSFLLGSTQVTHSFLQASFHSNSLKFIKIQHSDVFCTHLLGTLGQS